MAKAERSISKFGCVCGLVTLLCSVSAAAEIWPQVARRELIVSPPIDEAPVPLPAVEVPDPSGQDGPEMADPAMAGQALTLADLRQVALQYNPTLVQASMLVRAAQGRQLQAGLYPNPQIGYTGEEIGMGSTAGQQGSFVAQEIVTGGKRQLAQSVAGHEVTLAQHRLEAQRWRVMNAVRAGFYEVLLAQKTVSVNQDMVRVGTEAAEVTAKLRAAQELSKAEVLQASIEAERAKVGLFIARNRYRTAWYRLTAVVGQPDLQPAPLEGDLINDLPTITWEAALERLLAGSPELGQAQAAVQQARCKVALECAQRRGNFSVEAGLKYDGSAEQTLADVGVAIPLMIFDRNQGNIVAAQSQLIAATREVERVELELFQRFAEAFESYANANRQVQLFRSNVLDNARESLELVATGYREGEFDYLNLLTAQRTYFAANLEYLGALKELWERSVELDGLMLTGGLKAVE